MTHDRLIKNCIQTSQSWERIQSQQVCESRYQKNPHNHIVLAGTEISQWCRLIIIGMEY